MNKKLKFALDSKIIRFILVSGLNTVFGYGLFAILLYAGLKYPLALLVSTVCGILFNFKTIGAVVFKNRNQLLFFRFILVYAVVYSLNVLGVKLLNNFGASVYLSGAIMVFPVGFAAFFLNKKFVFHEAAHVKSR